MLRLAETPQVADDHQDVRVDRVDVKKVVLHLADDAAEHRQVVAENSVQVHAAQLVREATRLAKDLQKTCTVGRIAAEIGVDAIAVSPERAQGSRRHSLELGMALNCQECIE